MPRATGQHLSKPRTGIENSAVIGGQHENEVKTDDGHSTIKGHALVQEKGGGRARPLTTATIPPSILWYVAKFRHHRLADEQI
jgi:hypothetical protein